MERTYRSLRAKIGLSGRPVGIVFAYKITRVGFLINSLGIFVTVV